MKRSRLLLSVGVFLSLVIIITGVVYVRYANSKASESIADIPGAVVMSDVSQPATTSVGETVPTTTPSNPAPVEPTPLPTPAPRNPTAVISGVDGRRASGNVTIIKTTEGTFIRLEDNFDSSRAAPDNRVYLGNAEGRQIEIAKLKAPSGGQNFRIPDGINIADYTYIWIHCKAYNTTYGSGQIIF